MSTWRPSSPREQGGDEPKRVGEALGRVSRNLGGPDADLLGLVFSRWRDTVGAGIADHASPATLRGDVLTVDVSEPGWATQLRFLEKDILSRLEEAAGRPVAIRIEVRVRHGTDTPRR